MSANIESRFQRWRSLAGYVVVAVVTGFLASCAIGFLLEGYANSCDTGAFRLGPVRRIIEVVILGPLIETLLLSGSVALLTRVTRCHLCVLITNAVFWSILHSLICPVWGVVIFPAFVAFTFVYMKFNEISAKMAISAAFLTHAIHNLLALTLL